MLDVELFYALLPAVAAAWPIWAVLRYKLLVLHGDPPQPWPDDSIQRYYDRRYLMRVVGRVVMAALAIYYLIRALTTEPQPIDFERHLGPLLLASVGCLFFSLALAVVVRTGLDRMAIRQHPSLSGCSPDLTPRLISLVGCLAAGCVVFVGLSLTDSLANAAVVTEFAIVILFITQRISLSKLKAGRREIPLESPLGGKVAGVVQAFGFQAKAIVLVPSTLTNAWAFPNGSVVATTALTTLCTQDEVAAIIAHELSHLRDRDPVKIKRTFFLAAFVIIVLVAAEAFLVDQLGGGIETIIPCAFTLLIALIPLQLWIRARLTQPIEFKCDADVARIGLGDALASGLERINKFIGNPPHWRGMDKHLLSHPSTAERVARLRSGTAQQPI